LLKRPETKKAWQEQTGRSPYSVTPAKSCLLKVFPKVARAKADHLRGLLYSKRVCVCLEKFAGFSREFGSDGGHLERVITYIAKKKGRGGLNMQRQLLRDAFVKVAKEQVACDLAGEAVILHLKSGEYFGLNEVGARIWDLIQEPKTVGAVFETILQEYDVNPDQLEGDLLALLDQMAAKELIEVENG
jgi:Coenzyme PQQ synthesis protein D (PqqD)